MAVCTAAPSSMRDDDGGDGGAPVPLERVVPGGRQRADRADQRLARRDVVLRPRAPVNMLRAQIAQRLAQRAHLVQIPDDQRQRRLEMPLERASDRRETAAAGWAPRQTARS